MASARGIIFVGFRSFRFGCFCLTRPRDGLNGGGAGI
jgi:hypothetical protein